MIKSLRKKFVLINMLLVFLVLTAVFAFVAVTGCRQAVEQSKMILRAAVDRRDGQMASVLEPGKTIPDDIFASPVFVVRILSDGRAQLTASETVSITEEQLADIITTVAQSEEQEGIIEKYNLRWMLRKDWGETKIAFLDITTEQSNIKRSIATSVLSLLGSLAAFFVVSLFLSRWALRPVERAWGQQKRFVGDASHELKTPLTVILANTGILLENRQDTIENQIKWVENTAAEAGRMQQLVGNLLFLAKTDDAKLPYVFSDINLTDAVLGIVLAFESLAYEKGVRIQTDNILPDMHICGDENALKQLVGILLENAVKYSPSGSVVTVSLYTSQTKAVLTVNNLGEPLPPEAQAQIFERFYRGDAAREGEGYGLGLAIAKSIVEAHHGKIAVQSTPEAGTTFSVRI